MNVAKIVFRGIIKINSFIQIVLVTANRIIRDQILLFGLSFREKNLESVKMSDPNDFYEEENYRQNPNYKEDLHSWKFFAGDEPYMYPREESEYEKMSVVEISKILSDTWNEINGSTDNIQYFREQIRESEEAIQKYVEKRNLLGSFRDFLSRMLDSVIAKAIAEKERRDAEREEVAKFDNVFSQFLGDVKKWRSTIDSFVNIQIPTENESTTSNYTPVGSTASTPKRNLPMAWQHDRDLAEAGSSTGVKAGKKRFATSTPMWKPRVKPYKIPKKSPCETITTPEKLSKSSVIPDPRILVDPTSTEKDEEDCVITGEYRLSEEVVKQAIDQAVTVVEKKEKSRDYASEGARPKVEESAPKVPTENREKHHEHDGKEEKRSNNERKSIADLGLQGRSSSKVGDFAHQLLPKKRGAVEALEEFTKEILIRAHLNQTRSKRWTRIHISARCQYNWIGETAVRDLLHPDTEGGEMRESRIEDTSTISGIASEIYVFGSSLRSRLGASYFVKSSW